MNSSAIGARLVFGIILFFIGIYLLICGIRVRGIVYSNYTLHHTKFYGKYIKIVRVFCFLLFVIFSLNCIANFVTYSFENAFIEKQSVTADMNVLKQQYIKLVNADKISLATMYVSIAATIIMIFTAVFLTGKHAPVKDEVLSGEHPAFKKKK